MFATKEKRPMDLVRNAMQVAGTLKKKQFRILTVLVDNLVSLQHFALAPQVHNNNEFTKRWCATVHRSHAGFDQRTANTLSVGCRCVGRMLASNHRTRRRHRCVFTTLRPNHRTRHRCATLMFAANHRTRRRLTMRQPNVLHQW